MLLDGAREVQDSYEGLGRALMRGRVIGRAVGHHIPRARQPVRRICTGTVALVMSNRQSNHGWLLAFVFNLHDRLQLADCKVLVQQEAGSCPACVSRVTGAPLF